MVRYRKWLGCSIIFLFVCCLLFLYIDQQNPVSLAYRAGDYARLVVAEDGAPLRAFADRNGVWRYPVAMDEISPLYLEALINYEDRWFWYHPGINLFALVRATIQNLSKQRIVSGGSTLTMQVARLLVPHSRTVFGKIAQMFRAVQLEWHYSKQQILLYYLNHAPFGGTLEGVQAASYTYLGKSAAELSHAEAALLAVLPQAPSRYRPDRHPDSARKARDKVLQRLQQLSVWQKNTVAEALIEPVLAYWNSPPVIAPLLARRFKTKALPTRPLVTTININLQQAVEELLKNYISQLPARTSAAVLIVKNSTMAVKAYAGSADFFDQIRFGHVDMIPATRSPGSTLKPFLYGMAMDVGLIHSQSLLTDAPMLLEGYRPRNFSRGFSGPVSVSKALQRSLNVPAIQLLHHLGARKFVARIKNAGLKLQYSDAANANLAMILGGAGTNLESLVASYSALVNQGVSGNLRFLVDSPIKKRYLMSPGAAWIIRQILSRDSASPDPLSWKTGTSYGHRDFWSIGVIDQYTIGVWVGRPDGSPLAGHFAARTANPLLFSIVQRLPIPLRNQQATQPVTVSREMICWPLGRLLSTTPKELCHEKKQAWILQNRVPNTLPDEAEFRWQQNPLTITVNTESGKWLDASCRVERTTKKRIALWPIAVEPWIPSVLHRAVQIGDYDPSCQYPPQGKQRELMIQGLDDNAILRSAGAVSNLPLVKLQARGGEGKLYWFINGDLLYTSPPQQSVQHLFTKAGRYQIAVSDNAGNTAAINIRVLQGS